MSSSNELVETIESLRTEIQEMKEQIILMRQALIGLCAGAGNDAVGSSIGDEAGEIASEFMAPNKACQELARHGIQVNVDILGRWRRAGFLSFEYHWKNVASDPLESLVCHYSPKAIAELKQIPRREWKKYPVYIRD